MLSKDRLLIFGISQLDLAEKSSEQLIVEITFDGSKQLLASLAPDTLSYKLHSNVVFKTDLPITNPLVTISIRLSIDSPTIIASTVIDLHVTKLSFEDWVSLYSKIEEPTVFSKLKLKISIESASPLEQGDKLKKEETNTPTKSGENKAQDQNSIISKDKPINGIMTAPEHQINGTIVDKVSEASTLSKSKGIINYKTTLDKYRSKLYIFGDDANPKILEFDFESEKFREIELPPNLHLVGYSMATALPNGKIIITGGINKYLNIIVPTAFWYDPITNTARVLKDMEQPRYTHTVAYLDGEVYAIGGRYYGKDKEGVLRHVEKYNISTNKWTTLAELNEKRCTSSAVTQNGVIYVFGGYHGTGRLKSIERYHADTNKWEILPFQLNLPIEAGICYPLSDGKFVYIAGKDDSKNSAEVTLYDMENNKFEVISHLEVGRVLPKHAFYKDTVYVFGGCGTTWEKGSVKDWKFQKGGDFANITSSEMKVFSCATVSDYFELENTRNHGEMLYFFGDPDHPFIIEYSTTTKYIEKKKKPSELTLYYDQMVSPLPNQYILVFGGRKKGDSDCSKMAYLYDTSKNEVLFAAQMNQAKYSGTPLLKDGFVYVFGGKIANGVTVKSCERYNFRANRWEEIAEMNEPRAFACAEAFGDHIYVFGGLNGIEINVSIERYSIMENTWLLLEITMPFLTPKLFSFKLSNGQLLIFGQSTLNQALFDVSKMEITTYKSLLEYEFTTCGRNRSKLFVIGGSQKVAAYAHYDGVKFGEWNNIETGNISIEELKNYTLCSTIDIESRKPYPYSDSLAVGNATDREGNLFIFAKENNVSKIIKFDLKNEYFEEVEIPEGMKISRDAAAVGLADAKILITGGLDFEKGNAVVNNKAFLYSPHTNKVKQINPMLTCRYEHSLVMLDKYIYAIGGKEFFKNAKSYLASCERLNLKTLEWEYTASLSIARSDFGACALGNAIYVIGGKNDSGPLYDIERFTEANGWELFSDFRLPSKIEGCIAFPTSYNEILVIGGKDDKYSSDQVISLKPLIKKVEKSNTLMLSNRHKCKAAMHGNKIYMIGGTATMSSESHIPTEKRRNLVSSYEHLIKSDLKAACFAVSRIDLELSKPTFSEIPNFKYLYILGTQNNNNILRLDLENTTWDQIPVPPELKLWDYSLAVTLPNGKIFITGGINHLLTDIKTSAYLVDFSENAQTPCEVLSPMSHARYTHTSCYLNNYVYVMGGRYYGNGQNGVLDHCERYNLVKKEWQTIAPLKTKRCTAAATTYMNRVYIFGGYRGDGRVKTVERYNEVLNEWETVPLLLTYPIEAEAAIQVSKKEIILFGGKDDFAEQAYVTVYDVERLTVVQENPLKWKRILCKSAIYKDEIFIIGGNSAMNCEKAKIGEWNWETFTSYSSLVANNLAKYAAAQGR